ncbi:hypothetical protein [Tunturiibacter empetritectus]|uniref:hypothetical protein n=1 Tax=Tunturiibacter empetritectus TaxID=3069691 RepID=UPI003D9B36B2
MAGSSGWVGSSCCELPGCELAGEGVEGEAAKEVAAQSALYLVESAGGGFDPSEAEGAAEAVEFGAQVGVADELGSACAEEEEIFEEEGEAAEEG